MEINWKKYSFVIASEYREKALRSLSDKPKTPTQISKEIKIARSHVSKTLIDLSKENLVVCLVPERRRGRIYSLTKDGRKLLTKL